MELKITHQGAPVIHTDNVYIVAQSADIIALIIDMTSKHCDILGHGVDDSNELSIIVVPTEYSLFLKEGINPNEPTDISLVGYKGWEIFLSEITRYSLRVCLINNKGKLNGQKEKKERQP